MPEFIKHLPPLTTLKGFVSAARLESFSQAAEELHVSQAAVSRQIRKLEADLNAQLFVRERYNVRLTECGRRLYGIVNPLLLELGSVSTQIRRQDSSSVFVIYSDLSIASWLLMPLMRDTQTQWPDTEIRLISSGKPLESYDEPISVGLQSAHWDDSRFEVTTLCADEVFPVYSPAYQRNNPTSRGETILTGATLLHLQQPGSPWPSWREYCDATGQAFPTQSQEIVFTSYAALLDAVLRGHGIALVWKLRVNEYLKSGSLKKLVSQSLHWQHGVCAYVPRLGKPHKLTKEFVAWLQQRL